MSYTLDYFYLQKKLKLKSSIPVPLDFHLSGMFPVYPCWREDIQVVLKWLRHILVRNGSTLDTIHFTVYLSASSSSLYLAFQGGQMGCIIWRRLKGDKAVNKYHCSRFIYVFKHIFCAHCQLNFQQTIILIILLL